MCGNHTALVQEKEAEQLGCYCVLKVCWRSQHGWATDPFLHILFLHLSPPHLRVMSLSPNESLQMDSLSPPAFHQKAELLPKNRTPLRSIHLLPFIWAAQTLIKEEEEPPHWVATPPATKCHLSNASIEWVNVTSHHMKHKYCSLLLRGVWDIFKDVPLESYTWDQLHRDCHSHHSLIMQSHQIHSYSLRILIWMTISVNLWSHSFENKFILSVKVIKTCILPY